MKKDKQFQSLPLEELAQYVHEVLFPAMDERYVTKKDFNDFRKEINDKFDKITTTLDKILTTLDMLVQEKHSAVFHLESNIERWQVAFIAMKRAKLLQPKEIKKFEALGLV